MQPALDDRDPFDDVVLMARVACRDAEAFTELFDRHSGVVLGFLLRLLRSRALAEEVLQEVFLQVWQQATSYRSSRSTPRGWMLLLARSRALDRLRSERSRALRDETATQAEVLGEPRVQPQGTQRLEQAEDVRMLGAALGKLPQEQRLCIELAFFEGLTQSQISARLGTPLGTVKSRVLLGMHKLREALGAS